MNIFSRKSLLLIGLGVTMIFTAFIAGFGYGHRGLMLATVFSADPGQFILSQPSVSCQNGLPVVVLSWTESTNTDRYSVQRKIGADTSTSGFSSELLSQIRATTAADKLFVSTYGRTAHSYRIIAKGNVHTYSNSVSIVLPECKNVGTITLPPAPTPTPPLSPIPNVLPTATLAVPSWAVTSLYLGSSISFQGTGWDPHGTINAYEWRDGSCTTGELLSTLSQFTMSNFTVGSHVVYFRVKDNTGAWSTNCPSRIVTITQPQNVVPAASILAPASLASTFFIGASVALVGRGVDIDGGISEYEWRLGSCVSGAVISTLASFAKPDFTQGTHVLYFRVRDNVGAWSANCPSRSITVTAPTSPPQAQTKFPSWMTWGASVGWQDTAMSNFEAVVGKSPQMEAIFSHWGNQTFPFQYSARIRDKGRTMVIFWEAVDYNRPYFAQPEYSLDAVNTGSLDAFFTRYAQDAKSYGGPIILAPYSEFNGNWFPWGMTVQGNTPAKFISSWRRIHGIFKAVGTPNVKFAWVPNNDSVPDVTANNFDLNWPGGEYVDIVGLDGFNFKSNWESFDKMMNAEINRLKAYNKPVYILSLGAGENPNKPAWITDAFTVQLYKHPEVKGWLWFNENKEEDWRVNSSYESLRAFQEMLN